MAPTLKLRRQVAASAAEEVVARFDSYSQDAHAQGIKAARERVEKRAARRERARAAAARLRSA